ncbi:hypothetical protein [Pseudomonas sp. Marseille-P8916]|uniref:hypothetical protein n=1 Tax=unclassified Pseudomonas TaxID=196821 RepID=UPI001CE3BE72|nr:hypothetical protein [Pseudomonas sp. Marseille-P8916]
MVFQENIALAHAGQIVDERLPDMSGIAAESYRLTPATHLFFTSMRKKNKFNK